MKRAEFLKKAIAAASMALGMMLMTNSYTSDVYAGTRYQWRTNNVAHTYDIRSDQYYAILSALGEAASRGCTMESHQWIDTGVLCGDFAEGTTVCYAFTRLYMGERTFEIRWNNPDLLLGDYAMQYSSLPKGHIFVTWPENADPAASLAHQNASMEIVKQIVGEAPQDMTEKLKYYNDELSKRISYDYEGYHRGEGKQEPFHGLLEGSCVCSGYADAFLNLCWFSGIDCVSADCITQYSEDGNADHRLNAVKISGLWKKIDVTWNDQETWISYDYFLREMNESWQEHLSEPHAIVSVETV